MCRLVSAVAAACLLFSVSAFCDDHPWDISVDVGTAEIAPKVDPTNPVAKIGEDDILVIQILQNGKVPAEDRALLRFTQRVLELTPRTTSSTRTLAVRQIPAGNNANLEFTLPGTTHLLRFKTCSNKWFEGWTWDGTTKVEKSDCPLVVDSGTNTVTIYANTDAIGLVAEVDESTGARPAFDPANVRKTSLKLRTERPYWNLHYSGGFAFFSGESLRDEQYSLAPITDNPNTPADESEQVTIVSTGRASAAYEAALYATYMLHRPKKLPLGITFGVSAKVPVEELTAIAGVSARLKPFKVIDSVYVTTGIAYRGHQRLLPKYRETLRAPAGVTETDIVGSEHDVGLFVGVSFGFGGNEKQFRSVVSGGEK